VNREDGFIGTALKKDEFLFDCSTLDDIIAFTKRGIMKVVKVADKTFIGKDILHVALFRKNDERTTYNMIYMDGPGGKSYAKRFNVTGITRDKAYDLTRGDEKSKVHYLSVNPNAEAEIVKITLSPNCPAHKKEFEYHFAELEIKGRSSMGNTVTKYPIKSVRLKEAGVSTISGKKLWFDDQFGRLNTEEKGQFLGLFDGSDKILVVYSDGTYEVTDQELTQKLDPEKVIFIEKFDAEKVVTAVYVDMEKKQFMVKRFKIETTTLKTTFSFIKEGEGNYVETVTTISEPVLSVQQGRGAQIRKGKLKIVKLAEVTGYKTVGTKLADFSKSTEMQWVKSKESNQGELFV
jgi:topoisomerase-4 subunit A